MASAESKQLFNKLHGRDANDPYAEDIQPELVEALKAKVLSLRATGMNEHDVRKLVEQTLNEARRG